MVDELADKKQLHQQILAAWRQAQDPESSENMPVTVAQIASHGPFHSENLIADYLNATQGDDWVLKRDDESSELYVLAPQVRPVQ